MAAAGDATPPRKAHDTPRDAFLRLLLATTTRFDEEDVDNSFLQIPLLDYVKTEALLGAAVAK